MTREQTPFVELISYRDALDMVLEKTMPVDKTEEIPIEDATGRVLAENIVSVIDVPPFTRAAMDGFAVKAEDTFGAGKFEPVELNNLGRLHAGTFTDIRIRKTECIQIATGAPVPPGSDAVVKVEVTEKEGSTVSIYEPVHPGQNVSPAGEDIKKGDKVLTKDTVLSHAKIGALAAMGKETVKVYAKPTVAIIPTGDEVVPPGKELKSGQIYDVNSFTLHSLVRSNGGQQVKGTVVGDDMDGFRDAIRKQAEDCDLLLFSGGSSVGDRDLMADALKTVGKIHFHGVKIRPGKPTLFGEVNGTPVFGMPGYPTSCLTTALQLVMPVLLKMARLPASKQQRIKARLARRVVSSVGRQQYMPVSLKDGLAHLAYKQSGAITSMAHADGYFEISENVENIEKGTEVDITLF